MSATFDPRYFETTIEVNLPTAKFFADGARVSLHSISRLIFPIGLAGEHRRAQITFGDFTAEVVLERQHSDSGFFYCARFLPLSIDQAYYLRRRLELEGVQPNWQRRFPRIAVSKLVQDTNPHPTFCLFAWQGKDRRFKVVNFTVDGLRVSYPGELANLKVGGPVTLSVYSSTGTGISGLEAEIRNFSIRPEEESISTEIGLRLRDLRSPPRESYHALLRDCVVSLSQRKLAP